MESVRSKWQGVLTLHLGLFNPADCCQVRQFAGGLGVGWQTSGLGGKFKPDSKAENPQQISQNEKTETGLKKLFQFGFQNSSLAIE